MPDPVFDSFLICRKISSEDNLDKKQSQASSVRSKISPKADNYKRKFRYSGSTDVPNEIIDAVAGAKADNFNLRLDKAAKRMRLNRTQVKSVLRQLVESPDLLNYAMERAGDKPGTSTTQAEPRITRKLAKDVVSSGGKLNWFLEKVAQTPQKKDSESLALLHEEFPEDDPDQEYDPTADIEALKAAGAIARLENSLNDVSDDDNFVPSDLDGTPGRTSSVAGDETAILKTPNSEGFSSPATSTISSTDDAANRKCKSSKSNPFEFKQPTSYQHDMYSPNFVFYNKTLEDSTAVRSLNFEKSDHNGTSKLKNKMQGSGLEDCSDGKSPKPSRNTRSKASLKDVSIDELAPMYLDMENVKLPPDPDINFDTYETIEEESERLFAEFLKETYVQSDKGGDKDCGSEEPQGGEADDPDYEFNQMGEDHTPDEYRYNRSTKIPQKEVDALMQELLEAYSLDQESATNINEPANTTRSGNPKNEQDTSLDTKNVETTEMQSPPQQMTPEQYAMIGQQIRQHIQLLTQMTLLTSKEPMWQNLNDHCKEMTNELFSKSLVIKSTDQHQTHTSIVAQANLFPSLGVVQEWENLQFSPTEVQQGNKGEKYNLSPKLMEFMCDKPGAFIYPHLLPHSAINPAEDKMVFWSSGEDELIALQLEDYEKSNPSSKKCQANCLKDIHKNLIRNKTVPQIRSRYKNQTKKILIEKGKNDSSSSGNGGMNAILFYKEYKTAPRNSDFYQHVPYQTNDIWKKLKDMPLDDAPIVWKKHIGKLRGEKDLSEGGTDIIDTRPGQVYSNSGKFTSKTLKIIYSLNMF